MASLIPAEQVNVSLSKYSVTLQCSHPAVKEPVVIVTLPLKVAKEMAIILRKVIAEQESADGQLVVLKPAFYESLGVAPEDWPPLRAKGLGDG